MNISRMGLSSIVTKVILFVSLFSLAIVAGYIYAYNKQLSIIEQYNQSSMTAIENVFTISVADFLVTGDKDSLEDLINKSIKQNLIFGLSIFEGTKKDPIFTYPQTISNSLASVSIDLKTGALISGNNVKYVLYLNSTEVDESRKYLRIYSYGLVVVTILFILAIFLFLFKVLIEPIKLVYSNINLISSGSYSELKEFDSNDEIGSLAKAIIGIAKSIEMQKKSQEDNLNEIVKTNGALVLANAERSKLLNELINGASPHLTEALAMLQTLQDRPVQHALLNKLILFVITKFEQTRSIIDEAETQFSLSLEKMTFLEFVSFTKEYSSFFGANIGADVDFRLKTDASIEIDSIGLLIDKKLVIKLFSMLFEILSAKNEKGTLKVSIWLIVDFLNDDFTFIDLMIRSSNSCIAHNDCVLINSFFDQDEMTSGQLELDTTSFSLSTLRSLSAVTRSLMARYQISSSAGVTETRYSCRLLRCSADEQPEGRLVRLRLGKVITAIGGQRMLGDFDIYGMKLVRLSYDDFIKLSSVNNDTHYLLDMDSDRAKAKIIASMIFESNLTSKKFVLFSVDSSEQFIDYSYEVGADLVINEPLNTAIIKNINSAIKRRVIDDSVLTMIEKIKEK